MPRTIYGPRPGESDDYARELASLSHWDTELRKFRAACKVRAPANDPDENSDQASVRSLNWQPRNNMRYLPPKAISDLAPEDCRHFCFKDCAVYTNGYNKTCLYGCLQLYEKIYRRWYPTRAQDVDISHESFFCFFMAFDNEADDGPASVKEVLEFHENLCSKLDEEVPKLPDEVPRRNAIVTAERSLHLPPAQYKLRDTFRQCFIVIHAERDEHSVDGAPLKERGVILVWRREEDAVRHGCVPDAERGISREHIEGLGTAQAFRCSLDEAMRLVVSTEIERREMRPEWHGYYRQRLGESEDVSVELCRCSGCMPELYPDVMKLLGK